MHYNRSCDQCLVVGTSVRQVQSRRKRLVLSRQPGVTSRLLINRLGRGASRLSSQTVEMRRRQARHLIEATNVPRWALQIRTSLRGLQLRSDESAKG